MANELFSISDLLLSELPTARAGFLTRRIIPMRQIGRDGDGLIFIRDGQCRYTFSDGTQFTAKKHDILYLANDALYRMEVDCENYSFFVVNFVLPVKETRKSTLFHPRDKDGAERLFARLCTRNDLQAPSAAAERLSLFYRIWSIALESTESHYIGGKAKATIEHAAEQIHESCYKKGLSVAELAAQAGMSEVHFRRLFARRFGISPARYIMRIRINRAKELMADSALSLADIAEQSGFTSESYFHRVFRSLCETTPAAYRRRLSEMPSDL